MPIRLNESQTFCTYKNLTKQSQVNDANIFSKNFIGMENIENIHDIKAQTYENDIHIEELDQFIEVHELQTDIEMSDMRIQNIEADSLMNKPQSNKNNILIKELSQFIEVNKPQTSKDILRQSKNLKNIKKYIQPTRYICSICNLQFKYQHEYNKHMKVKHIFIKNIQKLKNKNNYIKMSVNESNHVSKTNAHKPCSLLINDDKIDTNKSASMQIDDSNVFNIIPVIQKKKLKINSIRSVSYMPSINLKCDKCDTEFKGEQGFIHHLKIEHSNKCKICNKSFINEKILVSHVRSNHKIMDSNKLVSICNNITPSHPTTILISQKQNSDLIESDIQEVNQIMNVVQINEYIKFDGIQAAEDQINNNEIVNVMSVEPNNELFYFKKKSITKKSGHVCNICDSYFSSKGVLKRHSEIDHKYKCPHCEKKCIRNFILKKHIRNKHDDKTRNSYIEELHVDSLSQLDKIEEVLPIRPSDEQFFFKSIPDIFQNNEIQNLLQEDIVSKEPLVETSHKMQINQHVKLKDLENIQPAIPQIALGDISDIMPIVSNDDQTNRSILLEYSQLNNYTIEISPNDKQTYVNIVQEHNQPNEILNRFAHNIQCQDVAAKACDEKKPKYVCSICDSCFSDKIALKRHSINDHKYKCPYCEKKYIGNFILKKHIRNKHDDKTRNSYIEELHVHSLSQLDKIEEVLPIRPSDEQFFFKSIPDIFQNNEIQNLLQEDIVSKEPLVETSHKMQINQHVKLKDLENIQPAIPQIALGDISDIMSIVSNDDQMNRSNLTKYSEDTFIRHWHIDNPSQLNETPALELDSIKLEENEGINQFFTNLFSIFHEDDRTFDNTILEHDQLNEIPNPLSHNIQLIDAVDNSCDPKKQVNKLNLIKHTQSNHDSHNENSCIEEMDIETSSQLDEIFKLPWWLGTPQPLNDVFVNNILDQDELKETQYVWQDNIVSEEAMVDVSNEMQIEEDFKFLEAILSTIPQTNCSDINDLKKYGQLMNE